jgi:hypothetical protein
MMDKNARGFLHPKQVGFFDPSGFPSSVVKARHWFLRGDSCQTERGKQKGPENS